MLAKICLASIFAGIAVFSWQVYALLMDGAWPPKPVWDTLPGLGGPVVQTGVGILDQLAFVLLSLPLSAVLIVLPGIVYYAATRKRAKQDAKYYNRKMNSHSARRELAKRKLQGEE